MIRCTPDQLGPALCCYARQQHNQNKQKNQPCAEAMPVPKDTRVRAQARRADLLAVPARKQTQGNADTAGSQLPAREQQCLPSDHKSRGVYTSQCAHRLYRIDPPSCHQAQHLLSLTRHQPKKHKSERDQREKQSVTHTEKERRARHSSQAMHVMLVLQTETHKTHQPAPRAGVCCQQPPETVTFNTSVNTSESEQKTHPFAANDMHEMRGAHKTQTKSVHSCSSQSKQKRTKKSVKLSQSHTHLMQEGRGRLDGWAAGAAA